MAAEGGLRAAAGCRGVRGWQPGGAGGGGRKQLPAASSALKDRQTDRQLVRDNPGNAAALVSTEWGRKAPGVGVGGWVGASLGGQRTIPRSPKAQGATDTEGQAGTGGSTGSRLESKGLRQAPISHSVPPL